MSKVASTHAIPAPPGFRFDEDEPVLDNARRAWDTKKTIQRGMAEHNARVAIRKNLRFGIDHDIAFEYHDAMYPDIPTFVLEDELFAFLPERGSLAIVEICGGCAKQWQFRPFSGIAGLGRELAVREANDQFLCKMCELLERSQGGK